MGVEGVSLPGGNPAGYGHFWLTGALREAVQLTPLKVGWCSRSAVLNRKAGTGLIEQGAQLNDMGFAQGINNQHDQRQKKHHHQNDAIAGRFFSHRYFSSSRWLAVKGDEMITS
jgi:hypothetical protein